MLILISMLLQKSPDLGSTLFCEREYTQVQQNKEWRKKMYVYSLGFQMWISGGNLLSPLFYSELKATVHAKTGLASKFVENVLEYKPNTLLLIGPRYLSLRRLVESVPCADPERGKGVHQDTSSSAYYWFIPGRLVPTWLKFFAWT